MIICDSNKFVFIHIPKNSGTTSSFSSRPKWIF